MLFEFWSHDRFVSHKNDHEIETLKSTIRQFRSHEKCRNQEIESIIRNFDLMNKNSTSWKSWILISWNLTSWPWVGLFSGKGNLVTANICLDSVIRCDLVQSDHIKRYILFPVLPPKLLFQWSLEQVCFIRHSFYFNS